MNFFKPKFWDKNKISIFAIILFPIAVLVQLLLFFKTLLTKKYQCSIPVICVGNIYLGGTGKTPLSIEIFSILKNLNMNPVFIRKRYDSFKDEVELQKQVGLVYENKKRVDALKEAIKNKLNIAILDDGFQDFSVNKNLSIICFNERQWIGNGLTIPSGPLRESLSSLKRANFVAINGNKNPNIENKITKHNDKIKIFYVKYKPLNIESFKNKKITAFAGIGNPENFFNLLKSNNISISEEIKFPDHYNFSNKEVENLINKAKQDNATLVTTEKDYFRINNKYKDQIAYLKVSIEIQDKDNFISEIKKFI